MKRSWIAALLYGCLLTLLLTFLSTVALYKFPDIDLPLMPKPFFLYALAPGIVAGEPFASIWMSGLAFILVNTIVYAFISFCVIVVARQTSRRRKHVS
ncbi:MAG TPA: hypothetical protein VJQ82_25940 [Terriglobales bacterium]|nr:hypothetical protein [Terriglobales bacterium]